MEVSELFAVYTDESAREESTRFATIPTAGYNGKVMDWKLRADGGEKQEKFRYIKMVNQAGGEVPRPMIALQVAVFDDNGKRIATVWPELSHVAYRVAEFEDGKKRSIPPSHDLYDRSLPLDGAFKLWASLSKMVDNKGTLSVGDTLRKMPAEMPVNLFITESFRDEETGEYHDYKTVEERTELQKAGYKSYNNVRRIGPYRKPKAAAA